MVMINCPECKEKVSDSALKCLKCGYQFNKPKRGIFGQMVKWSFIIFNITMLWWLVTGVGSATDAMEGAAKTGAGLGVMIIIIAWVIGDVILGSFVLITKPRHKEL